MTSSPPPSAVQSHPSFLYSDTHSPLSTHCYPLFLFLWWHSLLSPLLHSKIKIPQATQPSPCTLDFSTISAEVPRPFPVSMCLPFIQPVSCLLFLVSFSFFSGCRVDLGTSGPLVTCPHLAIVCILDQSRCSFTTSFSGWESPKEGRHQLEAWGSKCSWLQWEE